ncbi:MAG: glycosyl transferase [Deltaproteobacteria bacterium]|nr:glycosyl transferase [Deltaproteobacteria bacterium]
MADFHQGGVITTLHALHETFDREAYLGALEKRLEEWSRHSPIALILPSLYTEIENPGVLDHILDEIAAVRYLKTITVALGGAEDEDRFSRARAYFERLRTEAREVRVVWVDGPRIQGVLDKIREREIPTGVQGKGQSVWVALGYILARADCDTADCEVADCEVVALHDCDIVTYDRVMLGRLIEPTANPHNDYEFCKGYYARISPTELAMKGRVTRLFVTPLVDTLQWVMYKRGYRDLGAFFSYHRSFKYPLAGEFSFATRMARGINIAYDWGLEVSTLSEAYQRVMQRKIAQIDLAGNYEHKHQEMSPEDASRGLHRMVVDIGKFYLNHMRCNGVPLDDAFVDMILHTYYNRSLDFIKRYSDDAEVNGLHYDRYQEEQTVRFFRGFLWTAWEQIKGPHESTLIPSWNRVVFSMPEIQADLVRAVEEDNA